MTLRMRKANAPETVLTALDCIGTRHQLQGLQIAWPRAVDLGVTSDTMLTP